MKPTAEKIRKGLYRIVGVACACGGELRVERCTDDDMPLSDNPEFRWETFCTKCATCDCNGWSTLAACLAECEKYFNAKEPVPA